MTLMPRPHKAQSQARSALATESGIPPISPWPRQVLAGRPEWFASRRGTRAREADALQEALDQAMGRRPMA